MKHTAEGGVRDAQPDLRRQDVAQQGHGPADGCVAEGIRRLLKEPDHEPPQGLGQSWGPPLPRSIVKRMEPALLAEASDPVVHALPRDAEVRRDLRQRCAPIEVQERDDARDDPRVLGRLHLRPKTLALPRRQPKVLHGTPCRRPYSSGNGFIPQRRPVSNFF